MNLKLGRGHRPFWHIFAELKVFTELRVFTELPFSSRFNSTSSDSRPMIFALRPGPAQSNTSGRTCPRPRDTTSQSG